MCGDAAEGIELAVGRPRSPERSSDAADGERFLEDFLNQVPSDEEMAEFKRLEDVRRVRVDASPILQMARTFMKRAGDASATALGDGLGHLQKAVLNEFPKATEFRRPGFDEPLSSF